MKPHLIFSRHQYADTILRHEFTNTFDELLSALESVDVPLNPAGPFSSVKTGSRPKTPKRHMVNKKHNRYLLKPIAQKEWNAALDKTLRDLHWASQPIAITDTKAKQTKQKGDFAKDGIFVEVEFGNVASAHRDMLKFLVSHDRGTARVGVLACMVQRMTKLADSNLTAFETVNRTILPFLRLTPMPILFIGLDYRDSDEHILRSHYDDMYAVATENGVNCLTSDEVFKNPEFLLTEDSLDDDDSDDID
jgi:Restriction endonuclease BglII